jgi:hypothetical protein
MLSKKRKREMDEDNQAATKHNPSKEFGVEIFFSLNTETFVMNWWMINLVAPGTPTSINISGQTKHHFNTSITLTID